VNRAARTDLGMNKRPPRHPVLGAEGSAERKKRIEREAAALRENLRKRKTQARAREKAAGPLTPTFCPRDGERE
jgi:hypothetical protein